MRRALIALVLLALSRPAPRAEAAPLWLPSAGPARNVILLVAGGMGPEHLAAARLREFGTAEPGDCVGAAYPAEEACFAFETLGPPVAVTAYSTETDPSGPRGTPADPAAAATALAAGRIVPNGHLSKGGTGVRYLTILEIAQLLGKGTGLVTDSFVFDGGAAAFAAHVSNAEGDYAEIQRQILQKRLPTVVLGGGFKTLNARGYLGPNLHPSYRVIRDGARLGALGSGPFAPVLGAFLGFTELPLDQATNRFPWWDISREALTPESTRRAFGDLNACVGEGEAPDCRRALWNDPTLRDMAVEALTLLDRAPAGFFAVVHAQHIANFSEFAARISEFSTPTAAEFMLDEVAAFDRVAQGVLDWVGGRQDTLVLVAANVDVGGPELLCRNFFGQVTSCKRAGRPRSEALCWASTAWKPQPKCCLPENAGNPSCDQSRDGPDGRPDYCPALPTAVPCASAQSSGVPALEFEAEPPTYTTFKRVNAWARGPGAQYVGGRPAQDGLPAIPAAQANVDLYYAMQYAFTGTVEPIFPPPGIP